MFHISVKRVGGRIHLQRLITDSSFSQTQAGSYIPQTILMQRKEQKTIPKICNTFL